MLKSILNKKKVVILSVILLAVIVVVGSILIKNKKEKNVLEEKQRVEESRQQRMGAASWSRVSFFEGLPINVTLAIPSYLEGNYRIIKGADLVRFLYIKDPSNPVEMFFVRVGSNNEFNLSEGESELPSKCSDYKFSYKLSKTDEYKGSDISGFSQAMDDMKFFLSGEGYFECRDRK